MRNKKGFLLAEETLKIILAVISIGFLVYFLTALYFTNQSSKDLEQAEASLEHLIEQINLESETVEIYNPSSKLIDKWWITSWPREGVKPKKCSNLDWENCICVCERLFTGLPQGYADDCDSEGMCVQNPSNLVVKVGEDQAPIEIKNPPITLLIDKENKKITKK